ncbi:MAG: GvpL/GvpF family gas vesicle protein [Trebonia sp.]
MTARSQAKKSGTKQQTAVYIYGMLPADTDIESGTAGVGDPPGEVRLVRHRDLAAMVSDVDVDRPLGRPEDLTVHQELLDSAAGDLPVLPLRFGSVVTDDEAVTTELLEPHYDEFASALDELDGRAEYVVNGRYDENAIIQEVLAEDDEAAALRKQVMGKSEDETRDARIQLGEILNNATSAKRERDTQSLGDAVAGHVVSSVVRQPTHELDAVYTAFLVESSEAPELERALQQLASDWEGRVELRLMGPLAAYDFVGTVSPGD